MENIKRELVLMNGALRGTHYPIYAQGLTLGRSSSANIHVPDEEMSRNHCIFEISADGKVKVIDLASSNGTQVNGNEVGSDGVVLKNGDMINAGTSVFQYCEEVPGEVAVLEPVVQEVDLGLENPAPNTEAVIQRPVSPKRRIMTILWAVTVLVLTVSIALVLASIPDGGSRKKVSVASVEKIVPKITSVTYEKVEADSKHIFRYYMTLEDGVLKVIYDDLPGESRHVDKSLKLSEKALARIEEMFKDSGFEELDASYRGGDPDSENELNFWRIRMIRGTEIKDVLVENAQEPEAFAMLRDALETFSRNELGIWAVQYSNEKLTEMSAESESLGDKNFEERDVEYGNLSKAVKCYKEAISYLETVKTKPEGYGNLKQKLRDAEAELSDRYKEQRFRADQKMNLEHWEEACVELRILRDMIPDKDDPRHVEANNKLIDVEKRLRKEEKRK